jgi:Aldo/keto reductase family
MAQLAVSWVLHNDNVATALVGASRPEQVTKNVEVAGVKIPDEAIKSIDAALGDIVTRDPQFLAKSTPTPPPRLTADQPGLARTKTAEHRHAAARRPPARRTSPVSRACRTTIGRHGTAWRSPRRRSAGLR